MAMQIMLNSKTLITFELGKLMRHSDRLRRLQVGPQRASAFRGLCKNAIR